MAVAPAIALVFTGSYGALLASVSSSVAPLAALYLLERQIGLYEEKYASGAFYEEENASAMVPRAGSACSLRQLRVCACNPYQLELKIRP